MNRVVKIIDTVLPDWSSLRTLGQSRILGLTMLIPFLGTLIMFNQYVIDLLALSPDVLSRWLGPGVEHELSASRVITVNRLVVTYFGLVLVGGASFVFTLLCPREVKIYGSAQAYIETERLLITPARTALLVTVVAEDYLVNWGDEESPGEPPAIKQLAYPMTLVSLFEEVVREISEKSLEGADADIYSANGNIYIAKVARILSEKIKGLRALWKSFHTEAQKSTTDLLSIRYMALDHSKPVVRLVVSLLYLIGFSVLFYPTGTTMLQIVRRLFS